MFEKKMEDYCLALFNHVADSAFRPSDPGDSLIWLRPLNDHNLISFNLNPRLASLAAGL